MNKAKKYVLGKGNVALGYEVHKGKPLLSIRKMKKVHKVGSNLLKKSELPSKNAEVLIEISSLDGLNILKQQIQAAENFFKQQERYLLLLLDICLIQKEEGISYE